jgi:hypothetical protein
MQPITEPGFPEDADEGIVRPQPPGASRPEGSQGPPQPPLPPLCGPPERSRESAAGDHERGRERLSERQREVQQEAAERLSGRLVDLMELFALRPDATQEEDDGRNA